MKNRVNSPLIARKSKLLLVFTFIIISVILVKAQNFNLGTLYSFDKYSTNSAYGGLTGDKLLSINMREQWGGLLGRPRSYSILYNAPVYKFHGGAGVALRASSIGVQKSFEVNISYNYVKQTSIGLLSFGLGSGLRNMSIDHNKIRTPEGNYAGGSFNHKDTYILNNLPNQNNFYNFSIFGLYYYNNFEIGIEFAKELSIAGKLKYGLRDCVKLNWQYLHKLNETISLKVFGLLYSDFVLYQNDIGVSGIFNDIYFAGINARGYSYRTFDSVAIILGGNINNKMRLFYSYDITLSVLRKVEDGTHEIKFVYNLGKKNISRFLPPIINNPRL